MTVPSPDEFDAWKAEPVTQFVLAGLKRIADQQKDDWANRSWSGNEADPIYLARKRAMADCYTDLANITLSDALGANGVEPETAEPA